MRPFDPLATGLTGVHLIEASAGTGKTHAITSIVLRLLLERGTTIDKIAVLTFTRAAATELLERIASRLTLATQASSGTVVEDDVINALIARVPRDVFGARAFAARAGLDVAAVCTIHQFCAQVLATWPFETGAPLGRTTADATTRFRRAAHDAWSTTLASLHHEFAQLKEWPKKPWDTVNRVAKAWAARPDLTVLPAAATASDDATVRAALRARLDAWAHVPPVLPSLRGLIRENDWNYQLSKLHGEELPEQKDLNVLADLLVNAGSGAPEALNAWWRVHRETAKTIDAFAHQLLRSAAMHARDRAEQMRIADDAQDFDSLVLSARNAVLHGPNAPDLRRRIRETWPTLLVDEFQDTDDSQWDLFSAIYGETGDLFLIGDPKQAIYGFRGADVWTYLRARDTVPADQRATLGVNRRSDPAAVAAVNHVFSATDGAPFAIDGIGFEPATAHQPQRWSMDGAPGLVLLEGYVPKQEWVERTATEIVALLSGDTKVDGRPIRPRDIAVLLRKNDDIPLMTQALRSRAVPAVAAAGGPPLTTEGGRDVRSLVAALARPWDEGRVRVALLTPAGGHDAASLVDLDADPRRWDDVVAPFFAARERSVAVGVEAAMHGLLHALGAPARLLALEAGDHRWFDMEAAIHFASAQADAEHLDADALSEHLDQLASDGGHDEADRATPAVADAVAVMTLHASKGLEFGFVFLPTWHERDYAAPYVHMWHDANGKAVLDLRTPLPADAEAAVQRESKSDLARLAYVALTRARFATFAAVGAPKHPLNGPAAVLPPASRREALLTAANGAIRQRKWKAASPQPWIPPVTPLPTLVRLDPPAPWPTPRRVGSFSALTRHGSDVEFGEAPPPPTTTPTGPVRLGEFPRGASYGTLLHSLFEGLDFGHPTDLAHRVGRLIERAGVEATWRDPLIEHVLDVLATPLGGGLPPLSEVSLADRADEWAFHLPLATTWTPEVLARAFDQERPHLARAVRSRGFEPLSGLFKGFVDSVFCVGERWVIVDYKSNHLGGDRSDYGPGPVANAVTHHLYDLQYHLYAVALFRHLERRKAGFDPELHWGGVRYLFLRGMGPTHPPGWSIHEDRPSVASIQRLSEAFDG